MGSKKNPFGCRNYYYWNSNKRKEINRNFVQMWATTILVTKFTKKKTRHLLFEGINLNRLYIIPVRRVLNTFLINNHYSLYSRSVTSSVTIKFYRISMMWFIDSVWTRPLAVCVGGWECSQLKWKVNLKTMTDTIFFFLHFVLLLIEMCVYHSMIICILS